VKIRKLFAAAAVSAGLAVAAMPTASVAAEPAKSPKFGFSKMQAATPEMAKSKAQVWLKSVGKFDQAAFDKIWADEKRSVLDRTVDSLALGNTEAGALLANLRKPEAAPPAQAPAFLKDEKQDPFFRANVALAFAKAAANKMAYEEAIDALKGVSPELTVDPASFYFFKSVSEYATMKKDAAITTIVKMLDDVSSADTPARYTMVATRMFFDMQNWAADPKDLSNIEKLMDNSGRRLDLARGGEKTQDIQKKIVFRLDELIKELENKNKPGQCNGGNCPGGGDKPGNGNKPGGNTVNPTQNAPDSVIMGGSGKGGVDEKELRKIAEQWGTLPADKRAQVIQDITRDLPPKFAPMINNYFDALDKVHGYKK